MHSDGRKVWRSRAEVEHLSVAVWIDLFEIP
jgi:hypothetical protein